MVYSALEESDAHSLGGLPVEKSTTAPLLGSDAGVDSLTIVNLVVALEEQIQKKTGKVIILVDEDSLALQEHPFRTVGTLAAYVEKLIQRQP